MKESVSAILAVKDEIFVIKRQDYLKAFPGYHAFPGGKVDKEDEKKTTVLRTSNHLTQSTLLCALEREIKEELGISLELLKESGEVEKILYSGVAITPEFNPYRFKNHYFKIHLKNKPKLNIDKGEVEKAYWSKAKDIYQSYKNVEILAVPPMVKLLSFLDKDLGREDQIDLSLDYDPQTEVPMIESIYGVKQFLPLSNTFPPANRTNCFIIGDGIDESSSQILIDPSPRCEKELEKLLRSINKIGFSKILITHHHADHYEYAEIIAKESNSVMMMSRDTYQRISCVKGKDFFKDIEVELLEQGSIITQSAGSDIVVYEVPGHDEGQLAISPKSLNWFLAGDLYQTVGSVVIGGEEGDMIKYFNSLSKVIALKPRFIIPSHGIATGGVYLLEQTLEHRKKRESSIKALYEEGYCLETILESVYPDLLARLRPYAIITIKAHLKKIIHESK